MSLIYWWPLSGNLINIINNTTFNNNGWTIDNNGILGKCYAANNGPTMTTPANVTDTFTLACWIKNNSLEYPRSPLPIKISSGSPYQTGASHKGWELGHGATLSLTVNDGITSKAKFLDYNPSSLLGKWYHLVVSVNRETNSASMYINGNLVKTAIYPSIGSMAGSYTLTVGQLYGWKLDGYVQDLRIYDHALSALEARELSKGLVVRYTFDNPYAEPTTNLIHGKYQGYSSSLTKLTETFQGMEIYKNVVTSPYTGTAKDNAGFCHKAAIPHTQEQAKQPYLQLSFWKRLNQSYGINIGGYAFVTYTDGTTGQHSWSYSKSNWGTDTSSIGKWEYITARATLSSGKTVKEITRFYVYGRNATGGDCDFAGIQLEAKDRPTPFTTSSREFNLENETDRVLTSKAKGDNVYFVTDSGIGTQALRTKGTVSKVSFAASSYLLIDMGESITPTQFSLITYAKVNAMGHQTSGVISMASTETDPTNYQNYTLAQYDAKFQLNAAGSTTNTSLSSGVIKIGEWHLYAFVWDGATWSSYRDGVLYESKAAAFTADPFRYIYLGYNGAGGAARNADITWGDFRLYGKALTTDEILALAETRAAIDKSNNVYSHEFIEDFNENMVTIDSWEQGGIQDADGRDANNMANRLRTKYLPVLGGLSYTYKAAAGINVRYIHYYDADNKWISAHGIMANSTAQTTPDNAAYVRWVIQYTDASLAIPAANIADYGAVMMPTLIYEVADIVDSSETVVNKTYNINTNDICENHKAGIYKKGTMTGRNFNEV